MTDLYSTLAAAPTGYLRDILDQPAALHDTLDAFSDFPSMRPFAGRLASGDLHRVVLTGMGSSYHALHPLTLTLIARGLSVQMLETSELIHYAPTLLKPRTLLVVVSQSGRSAEVVGLLERTHGRVPLVGVTNTADSPLAAQADALLLTRPGDEFSVSSKTYIAALAALAWLGDALAGQDTLATRQALDAALNAMERYLALWTGYVDTLCKQMADVRYLILVGRGPSLAAVGTGALIVKESAHFPAEGLSSAAFRHGPLEMAAPDIFVLVFSGTAATAALNARLADDVRAAGGLAALVHESAVPDVFALPPVPDIARPLLELLPVQMLSVALARLKGHEAGRFGHASKVTLTE
jgi:glucosamine--fructose-6-phosphate aminotransferase (isomerizing)